MDQRLFDEFLRMESEYKLFDLKEPFFSPVWDVLRVELFNSHILRPSSGNNRYRRSLLEKIRSRSCQLFKGLMWPRKLDYVFVYSPIIVNSHGRLYDRMAEDLISFTKNARCMYLGAVELSYKAEHRDYGLFYFRLMASFGSRSLNLSYQNYDLIHQAIQNTFNIDISYNVVNAIFRLYVKEYFAYKLFLSWIHPKKVFVSMDLQKGLYVAAKERNIPTCEIQHGCLVYQYPSYSYPASINSTSNVAFADTFAMPGEGWGLDNCMPCKKRVILGNSHFGGICSHVGSDGSIVIISNAIHCKYLIPFSISLSKIYQGKIIYKLHPLEYPHIDEYKKEFEGYSNIEIAPIDSDMSELLAKCSLVVTISSTVFFEAKTMGKRVAILKEDNYYIIESYVKSSHNTCIIEKAEDVFEALKMPESSDDVKYYLSFDADVAKELLND